MVLGTIRALTLQKSGDVEKVCERRKMWQCESKYRALPKRRHDEMDEVLERVSRMRVSRKREASADGRACKRTSRLPSMKEALQRMMPIVLYAMEQHVVANLERSIRLEGREQRLKVAVTRRSECSYALEVFLDEKRLDAQVFFKDHATIGSFFDKIAAEREVGADAPEQNQNNGLWQRSG